MAKLTFTIGEVATLLNITPKTIRHYHKIGLLDDPIRDANTYRLYQVAHIQQLQQILQLKQFGLSLKQIKLIIQSDEPDLIASIVLKQHATTLENNIAQLQHQLKMTQALLASKQTVTEHTPAPMPRYSAMTVLKDTIKPHANALADALVELEQSALSRIDEFTWAGDYEDFWYRASQQFIQTLQHESLIIVWIERYLALMTMGEDDRQAQAWLQELSRQPTRKVLVQSLMLPQVPDVLESEQDQIRKLIPALLYEGASPLQKEFLAILLLQKTNSKI